MEVQVVNKYAHKSTSDDIYIGRGTPVGNPYSHLPQTSAKHQVANRDEAVDKYREWFAERVQQDDPGVMRFLGRLCEHVQRTGRVNLVCFCAPRRCHGDVIKAYLEIASD